MSEIHGAVGSYVVNALDGDELAEFEAHLAVCATCRREVVEFSETAAHLGSVVETPPPPALRGSILAAIKEVRPLPPEQEQSATAEVTALPRRAAADAGPDGTPDEDAGPTTAGDELTERRLRRTRRFLALAVAAALVIAIGLGGWVADLRDDRQAQVAASNREQLLLAAPDAKMYTKTMNGATVKFVVSKSRNQALFVGDNIPDPGAGHDYQLWTLKGTAAIPDAVFQGGTNRSAWVSGSVDSSTGVAVTIEPKGGSPTGKPTSPAIVSVAL